MAVYYSPENYSCPAQFQSPQHVRTPAVLQAAAPVDLRFIAPAVDKIFPSWLWAVLGLALRWEKEEVGPEPQHTKHCFAKSCGHGFIFYFS